MSLSYSLQHLIAVALVAGGGSAVGVHLLAQNADAEPKPTGALIRHHQPSSVHLNDEAKTGKSKDTAAAVQDKGALDSQDFSAHPQSAALTSEALSEASAEPASEDVLDDSEQGHSLSDSLARLEAEYKAMLARTDRIEGELLAMKVDRLEQELQKANAQAAEQQAAAARQEAAAREHAQQASSQELSLSAENGSTNAFEQGEFNQAGRAPAPAQTTAYAAQTTSYGEPDNSTTITQSNQMVVYNYVPIVVNTEQMQTDQTDKQNRGKTTHTSTRSLYGLSMQHQRAIRSPLSTQSTALGTPSSPWAPIDMSKHHNPWSSSQFP